MIGRKGFRTLRCSFCRMSEREVDCLLGGPAVFICDACVSVCNRILDATPASFVGWTEMTDQQLLGALKTAEATVDAVRSVLQVQIAELRRREVSWETIGAALGISRQAAWERFS